MRRLLYLLPLCFALNAEAQQFMTLSESTAAETRIPFYLVDVTDNETPETGLTISGSECQWSENGAAFGNCAGTITELAVGLYYYVPAAAEIDTAGFGVLKITEAAANTYLGTVQIRPFDLTIGQFDGLIASESGTTIGLASGAVDADDQFNNGFALVVFDSAGSISAQSCIADSTNSGDTVTTANDISALIAVNDRYVLASDALCGRVADLAAVPSGTALIVDAINWLFMVSRNKIVQDSAEQAIYRDDASTKAAESDYSKSGSSTTRGEFGTPD